MARWSLRKSGEVRTTIRVNHHVPRVMIDWIMSVRRDVSETEALDWVRRNIHELTDEWKVLAMDDTGELVFVDPDEVDTPSTEGYMIYDGARVV